MVIQRWQSVMLLIVVALMTCFSFISLGQVQTDDYSFNFTCLGFSVEGDPTGNSLHGMQIRTWFLFIVAVMSAVIPFITIFLYKNLSFQKTLCLVEVLFLISTICIAGWEGYRAFDGAVCSWSSLALAPFLSLILVITAWTMINKDQKLLKSVDRIR